jgi:DNA-directed RNA polymerase subunit RPC12/RpoP
MTDEAIRWQETGWQCAECRATISVVEDTEAEPVGIAACPACGEEQALEPTEAEAIRDEADATARGLVLRHGFVAWEPEAE